MNNAHDTSLHEMLRMVNIQLSEREVCGLKQCSVLQERLFKKSLYFNPGVNIGSHPDS